MPAPDEMLRQLVSLHGRIARGPNGDLSDSLRDLHEALSMRDPDAAAIRSALDDVEVQMMFHSLDHSTFADMNVYLDEVGAWAGDVVQELGDVTVADAYEYSSFDR